MNFNEKKKKIKLEIKPLNLDMISVVERNAQASHSSRAFQNYSMKNKSIENKTSKEENQSRTSLNTARSQNKGNIMSNNNILTNFNQKTKSNLTKKALSPVSHLFSPRKNQKDSYVLYNREVIHTLESTTGQSRKGEGNISLFKKPNEISILKPKEISSSVKNSNRKVDLNYLHLSNPNKNIYKIFNKNNETFNKIISLSRSVEKNSDNANLYKTINFNPKPSNENRMKFLNINSIKSKEKTLPSNDTIESSSYINQTNNTIFNTLNQYTGNSISPSKTQTRYTVLNTDSNMDSPSMTSRVYIKTEYSVSNDSKKNEIQTNKKRMSSLIKKSIIESAMGVARKSSKKDYPPTSSSRNTQNSGIFSKKDKLVKNTINIPASYLTHKSNYEAVRKLTLSNTHLPPKEEKFMSLNSELDKNLKLLKEIPFVKNFSKIKIFHLWKNFNRKQNYFEKRQNLGVNLNTTIFNKNIDNKLYSQLIKLFNDINPIKEEFPKILASNTYHYSVISNIHSNIQNYFNNLVETIQRFTKHTLLPYCKQLTITNTLTNYKLQLNTNKLPIEKKRTFSNIDILLNNILFLIYLYISSFYAYSNKRFLHNAFKFISNTKSEINLKIDKKLEVVNFPSINDVVSTLQECLNNILVSILKAEQICKIKEIILNSEAKEFYIKNLLFEHGAMIKGLQNEIQIKLNTTLKAFKDKLEYSSRKFKSLKETISINLNKLKIFSESKFLIDSTKNLIDLQEFFKTFNLKFEDKYEVKTFTYNLTNLKNDVKNYRNEYIIIIRNKIKIIINEKISMLETFIKECSVSLNLENESSLKTIKNKFKEIVATKENLEKYVEKANDVFMKNKNEVLSHIKGIFEKCSKTYEKLQNQFKTKFNPSNLISENLDELEKISLDGNNIDQKHKRYEMLKSLMENLNSPSNIDNQTNERLVNIFKKIIFNDQNNSTFIEIQKDLCNKVTNFNKLNIHEKLIKKCLIILLYENSSFEEFESCIKRVEKKVNKNKVILLSILGKHSLLYKDFIPEADENFKQLEILSKMESIVKTILELFHNLKFYLLHKKLIVKILELKPEFGDVNVLIDEDILISTVKVILACYMKFSDDSILFDLKELLTANIASVSFLIKVKNDFYKLIYSKYPKAFYLSDEEIFYFISLVLEFKELPLKEIPDKINYFYSKINNFNISFEYNNDDNYEGSFVTGINEKFSHYLYFENKINLLNFSNKTGTKDLIDLFNEIDNETKFTLKYNLINSLNNFSRSVFQEWIFSQNNQIIICNLNLIFVNEINQILIEGNSVKTTMNHDESASEKEKVSRHSHKNIKIDLDNLYSKYTSWFETVIKKMSNEKFATNSPNILLTLQNQKNILENLIGNQITQLESFDWLKYIRHLWDSSKKEIIIECGGWSTYQQYNYIGNYYRILVTPQTEKIFLFNASCFREKSASFVKINTNSQGYLEIFKEFATNFWINVVSLDISKDDANFSYVKKIFDISTLSRNWIFLHNIESTTQNDSLIFLSKIMQIIQQEIILNEIKLSDSNPKIQMFCLMGCLKIDSDIKQKEFYFKSSSRILNLIKPEIKFFTSNIPKILGIDNKNLSQIFSSLLSDIEKMIKSKNSLFYFDFYLLNFFSKYLIRKVFNNKISSSNKNFLIKLLFEFAYPFLKNYNYSDQEIVDFLVGSMKNFSLDLGLNFQEIFDFMSNHSMENKIKLFYEQTNKLYNENILKITNNLINLFDYESKKLKLIPLVYGSPASGKTAIINSFVEFSQVVLKKTMQVNRIHEYEIIYNHNKTKNQLERSKENLVFHLTNNNPLCDHLFKISDMIFNLNNDRTNIILESTIIKDLSTADITLYSLQFIQNYKYKKLLKHFIFLLVTKLKKFNILINDEYNLSIVEFVTKLFRMVYNEALFSEGKLYYKAIELNNTVNCILDIYLASISKRNNQTTSKSLVFNILIQSLLIIFNNCEVLDKESFIKNILKNIKNLTKSIIKEEIGKEFLLILSENYSHDFYLDFSSFNFIKFDLSFTNKIINEKLFIKTPQMSFGEYLMEMSVLNKNAVVVIGKPYQGKSFFINHFLNKINAKVNKLNSESTFSLDSEIDNDKIITSDIIYIDDLNINTLSNLTVFDYINTKVSKFSLAEYDILPQDKEVNLELFYKYNKIVFSYNENTFTSIFKSFISYHIMNEATSNFLVQYANKVSKSLNFKDVINFNNLLELNYFSNDSLLPVYFSFYDKINNCKLEDKFSLLSNDAFKNRVNNVEKLFCDVVLNSNISAFILISNKFIFDYMVNSVKEKGNNYNILLTSKMSKKINRVYSKLGCENNLIIYKLKQSDEINSTNEIVLQHINNKNNTKIIFHMASDEIYKKLQLNTNINKLNALVFDFTSDNPFVSEASILNDLAKEKISQLDSKTENTVYNFTNEISIDNKLTFALFFSKIYKLLQIRKNEEHCLDLLNSYVEQNKLEITNAKLEINCKKYSHNDLLFTIKKCEEYLTALPIEEYEKQFEKLYTFEKGLELVDYFQTLFFKQNENDEINVNFSVLVYNKFSLLTLIKYLKYLDFSKNKFYSNKENLDIRIIDEDSYTLFNLLYCLYDGVEKTREQTLGKEGRSDNTAINKSQSNIFPTCNYNHENILGDSLIISFIFSYDLKDFDDFCIHNLFDQADKVVKKLKIKNSSNIKDILTVLKYVLPFNYNFLGNVTNDITTGLKIIRKYLLTNKPLKSNYLKKIQSNFDLLLELSLLSKSDNKSYTEYSTLLKNTSKNDSFISSNNLYKLITLSKITSTAVNSDICYKNKMLIPFEIKTNEKIKHFRLKKDLLSVIKQSLKCYREIRKDEEFINSEFFYLEEFKLLYEEKHFFNFKYDFYLNNVLEKIFLSLNNKFLFAILITLEIMINSSDLTKEEGKFIIEYINDNFEIENDNSIKFRKSEDFTTKAISYAKKLIDLYTNLTREGIIKFSTSFVDILEDIISKFKNTSNGVVNNPSSYLNSIAKNSEKLLFYLIFLEDQSISFFKLLINKFLRPIHPIDQFKLNNLLKKKNRLPISIKSHPSINLTNFLCSLAAYYEIDFFIIREKGFYKLVNINSSNNFDYKYILDYGITNLVLEGLKSGCWFLFSNQLDEEVFLKLFEIMKANEKIIHTNFKLFFDVNLVENNKKIKSLIEHFSILLNVDHGCVDDLEAAHDMWVNVLDENLLSETVMEESDKNYLILNANCKNDISSISNKLNVNNEEFLERDEKSILNEIKRWKFI